MKYSYYPGCSLEATSVMYDASVRAVFEHLDCELIELEDWNCCGATAYMSVNEVLSFCVSARNLALAEKIGLDLVTPCSGCYVTLNKTHHYYQEFPDLREKINEALAAADLRYRGNLRIRHALDPIVHDLGLEAVAAKVKKPLTGLKVAPYYGCQVVRPYTENGDHFKPMTLDHLLTAIGAEVTPFEYKTRCCGGSQMGTNQDMALRMVSILLRAAKASGAEMIATTCPLCQINLEAYQAKLRKDLGDDFSMPVVYFTQLMALAFGLPEKATMFGKHIEPVEPKLAAIAG